MVFSQAQQHRVVEHPPGGIGQRHVFSLPNGTPRQIARRQQARKMVGIRPGNFHLSLASHIPQCDVVNQTPVIGLWAFVIKRHVHVVVDCVGLTAVTPGGVEKGRFAHPRAKNYLWGVSNCVHCSSFSPSTTNCQLDKRGWRSHAAGTMLITIPDGSGERTF